MTITKNDTNVLAIEGRIDSITAPDFEKEVVSLGEVNEVTFDFEKVEYISSAGLRVLLKAQKSIGKKGKVRVINANDDIKEIFEMTGFEDVITIE